MDTSLLSVTQARREPAKPTDGILPLTIKLISQARRLHQSAPFKIDGVEIHKVTLVAHLIHAEKEEDTLSVSYVLDDGTHRKMRAKQFLRDKDSDEAISLRQDERFGFYVRVHGQIDQWKNTISLKVNHIRRCPDPHELYFHSLEVFFVARVLAVGPPLQAARSSRLVPLSQPDPPSEITMMSDIGDALPQVDRRPPNPRLTQSVAHGPGNEATNQMTHASVSCEREDRDGDLVEMYTDDEDARRYAVEPVPPAEPSGPGSSRGTPLRICPDPWSHLTLVQRAILLYLFHAPESESGVPIRVIAQAIQRAHHNVGAADIADAFEYLMDEDYISYIFDEYHCRLSGRSSHHYPSLNT